VEFDGCDKGVADLSKDRTVWVDEDDKPLKPIRKWWQDECIFKVRYVMYISAPALRVLTATHFKSNQDEVMAWMLKNMSRLKPKTDGTGQSFETTAL
jgi:hypothetical protein